jgi:DNA repair protein RecO (recombination protein O)
MPLLVTDALVLHSFDYLESSRILRLATRELGVQSVLARGARRSQRRYGSALDLFAEGVAELQLKPGRDMHTLAGFDVQRGHPALALELDRFTAASAVAELTLRFTQHDPHPELYDTIVHALDRIALAERGDAAAAALAAVWRIVGELGFTPALDRCSICHEGLAASVTAVFSHPAGGVLCPRCARTSPGSRVVPPEARAALLAWTRGEEGGAVDPAAVRAHQRLLREFLREHLTDGRPLRAFELWERERWIEAAASRPA